MLYQTTENEENEYFGKCPVVSSYLKPKNIVVNYELFLPQAVIIWADSIGNSPRFF